MANGETTEIDHESSGRNMPLSLLEIPPGGLFHGVLVVVLVALTWAVSYPGINFLIAVPGGLLLGLLGLVWVFRILSAWAYRQVTRQVARAWMTAPLLVMVFLAITVLSLPLRARFAVSKPYFDSAVENVAPAPDWDSVDTPATIGLYQIRSAYAVEGGVIFYERWGSFIDDAGFAYLPNGAGSHLSTGWFEAPQFRHLQGDWYAWTASW